jgi:hypothetical protein
MVKENDLESLIRRSDNIAKRRVGYEPKAGEPTCGELSHHTSGITRRFDSAKDKWSISEGSSSLPVPKLCKIRVPQERLQSKVDEVRGKYRSLKVRKCKAHGIQHDLKRLGIQPSPLADAGLYGATSGKKSHLFNQRFVGTVRFSVPEQQLDFEKATGQRITSQDWRAFTKALTKILAPVTVGLASGNLCVTPGVTTMPAELERACAVDEELGPFLKECFTAIDKGFAALADICGVIRKEQPRFLNAAQERHYTRAETRNRLNRIRSRVKARAIEFARDYGLSDDEAFARAEAELSNALAKLDGRGSKWIAGAKPSFNVENLRIALQPPKLPGQEVLMSKGRIVGIVCSCMRVLSTDKDIPQSLGDRKILPAHWSGRKPRTERKEPIEALNTHEGTIPACDRPALQFKTRKEESASDGMDQIASFMSVRDRVKSQLGWFGTLEQLQDRLQEALDEK